MTMDLFSSSKDFLDEEPRKPKVYSVVEITRQIKFLIEESFPSLMVQGEISNFTRHGSGHLYFTLKDEMAQIKCVVWRSDAETMDLPFTDGNKVIVRGRLALYEKGGYYQMTVSQIQPIGTGELQAAFERLKRKLFEEGLFDEVHKKPIPAFPQTVGIVTSPTGAAIRDIISVSKRRWPGVELILRPTKVQGIGAADDIVRAIEEFEEYRLADVLIIGRGGGSLEDLWAFNEEKVARAIFACTIPTISAVGHEIDFTITDFVADVRAATPSAAAELAVPDRAETQQQVRNLKYTLTQNVSSVIEQYRDELEQLQNRYAFRQPATMVGEYRQQTDDLERQLVRNFRHRIGLLKQKTEHIEKHLSALNPRNTLRRGYSIARQNGKIVQRAKEFSGSNETSIEFFDGSVKIIAKKE
ncbi:exodeoxyribonuclease VII large subunit [bacterium]|nr:exodeoxyribonuclease VII large subunit [bacterium]